MVARVDDFLRDREKSIETIANTIFPLTLYRRYGHPAFIGVFHDRVLPKVRKNGRWSGYYFERMTHLPVVGKEKPLDQLSDMIDRINNPKNAALNKYEVSVFDPDRDLNNSVYGGQCLSFLSFHIIPPSGDGRRNLLLTAQYRNQYYVEKLLGNLIGLGRLMAFTAEQTGLAIGALTVISTHAEVDLPTATRADIAALLDDCGALVMPKSAAA